MTSPSRGGIMRSSPTAKSVADLRLFAHQIVMTDSPNRFAIPVSVSPVRTVYVLSNPRPPGTSVSTEIGLTIVPSIVICPRPVVAAERRGVGIDSPRDASLRTLRRDDLATLGACAGWTLAVVAARARDAPERDAGPGTVAERAANGPSRRRTAREPADDRRDDDDQDDGDREDRLMAEALREPPRQLNRRRALHQVGAAFGRRRQRCCTVPQVAGDAGGAVPEVKRSDGGLAACRPQSP